MLLGKPITIRWLRVMLSRALQMTQSKIVPQTWKLALSECISVQKLRLALAYNLVFPRFANFIFKLLYN